jgi:hypothetical protein
MSTTPSGRLRALVLVAEELDQHGRQSGRLDGVRLAANRLEVAPRRL